MANNQNDETWVNLAPALNRGLTGLKLKKKKKALISRFFLGINYFLVMSQESYTWKPTNKRLCSWFQASHSQCQLLCCILNAGIFAENLLSTVYLEEPEKFLSYRNLVLTTMSRKPKTSTRVQLPLPVLLLAKHRKRSLFASMSPWQSWGLCPSTAG